MLPSAFFLKITDNRIQGCENLLLQRYRTWPREIPYHVAAVPYAVKFHCDGLVGMVGKEQDFIPQLPLTLLSACQSLHLLLNRVLLDTIKPSSIAFRLLYPLFCFWSYPYS